MRNSRGRRGRQLWLNNHVVSQFHPPKSDRTCVESEKHVWTYFWPQTYWFLFHSHLWRHAFWNGLFFLVFFGMTTCTLPSVTKSHYHQPDYTFPAAWSDPGGRSHLEHNSYCIGPKIRHCTFHLSSFDPVCWKLACVPFLYGSLPLCHYALYLRWFYPMCKEETPIMQLQNGVSFPRGWKISGSNH